MTDGNLDRRRVLAAGGALTAGLMLGGTEAVAGRNGVTVQRVVFNAPDGVRLVGHLRTPAGGTRRLPAVLLSNAMTSVKEQSVQTGYAQGLAKAGFVTLTFDQRRFGESGGLPRQHEDNEDRLTDLQVAVSYLSGLPKVDPDRIGALGVSIGGGLVMKLTAIDPRVRAFVAIAAGLLDPQRLREILPPGAYPTLLAEQAAALQRYHRTGELDYIPVVRTPGSGYPDNQPVLFDNTIATEYYGTERGGIPQWTNRATVLSLRTILVHDTRQLADLVGPRAGLLAVGALDNSTFPADHQAIYDRLTGPRRLVLVPGAYHNDLYDQPQYVQEVVDEAVTWFRTHLA